MKKIIWVIVIIAIVWLGWTLFKKPAVEVSKEPIKIGFVGALSGVGASIGAEELKGAELAVAEINDGGGINGRLFKLVAEDVSLDKMRVAGSATQKLINVDKVVAIIGPQWDEPAAVILPIIEAAKVPTLGVDNTHDLEAKQDTSYFFSLWYDHQVAITKLLEFAKSRGWNRVAIVKPLAAGFWEYTAQLFTASAPQYGIEVIENMDLGNPLSTDFRTPLAKIKSKNPDAIFIATSDPVECPFLQQLTELKMNTPVLSTEAAGNYASLGQCAKDMERLYIAAPKHYAGYQNFASAFQNQYQREPQYPSAVTAYDAVKVVALAFGKTNGTSGQKLRDLIAATNLDGAASLPTVTFDAKGFVVTPTDVYEIQTVNNGQFVKLEN